MWAAARTLRASRRAQIAVRSPTNLWVNAPVAIARSRRRKRSTPGPRLPRPALDAPSTRPSPHAAHAVRHDDFADIHEARAPKPTRARWCEGRDARLARHRRGLHGRTAAVARAVTVTVAPGQLVVTGLPHAKTLTIADLEALGAEDVPWTIRDVQHVYRAVALDRVLTHCGFEEGPGGRSIPPTGRSPGVGRTCGFLRGLPVCRLEEFGRVDREQTGRGPLQGTSGREAGELPDAGLWAA